jgi:hypothetical protein
MWNDAKFAKETVITSIRAPTVSNIALFLKLIALDLYIALPLQ